MKKFLSEYGFAILACIVVITFITMCTPVGRTIQSNVSSIINSFSKTADRRSDSSKAVNVQLSISDGKLLAVVTDSNTDHKYQYRLTYSSNGITVTDD